MASPLSPPPGFPPAGGVPASNIWQTLQPMAQGLQTIGATLKAGVTISVVLPSYAVASLPATATTGQMAYATNGRNTGEGAGAGTGCPVFWKGASWCAIWSGVTVTS